MFEAFTFPCTRCWPTCVWMWAIPLAAPPAILSRVSQSKEILFSPIFPAKMIKFVRLQSLAKIFSTKGCHYIAPNKLEENIVCLNRMIFSNYKCCEDIKKAPD